ncbi:hypothetical protein EK21DRAFT_27074, partial [Setomelanomma holmii]
YFDMLNETEHADTIYTLTIRCPPRPPPTWLPALFTRHGVRPTNIGSAYTIKPDNYGTPNYDYFTFLDMPSMPTKIVKVKSWQFPANLRCEHVQETKECDMGCYVSEKGGDHHRWKCAREDCQGHVFDRNVLADENGLACFGEKGRRMMKKAAAAAPRPARAGTMVFNGAAAPVACCADPEAPE